MYNEAQLVEQIKSLGIAPEDIVTIHISLKAVGEIDDHEKSGAEVMISALRKCLSKGLLLVPAHTYKNIRETPVFDIRNTKPCIGTLPGVAVQLANEAYDRGDKTCVRSMHQSHSVVAFGEKAYEYVEDDRRAFTPTPGYGSYGKLREVNGKILLIGVDFSKNTFFHAVDEYIEPEAMDPPYDITAIDYDGTVTARQARNCSGDASQYVKYEPYLREFGALKYGQIGDAKAILCDAKVCFDEVVKKRDFLLAQ